MRVLELLHAGELRLVGIVEQRAVPAEVGVGLGVVGHAVLPVGPRQAEEQHGEDAGAVFPGGAVEENAALRRGGQQGKQFADGVRLLQNGQVELPNIGPRIRRRDGGVRDVPAHQGDAAAVHTGLPGHPARRAKGFRLTAQAQDGGDAAAAQKFHVRIREGAQVVPPEEAVIGGLAARDGVAPSSRRL